MKNQDFGDFDNVVQTLRGRVWRDWLVGAMFAIGVVVNFAAVDVAVKAALSEPTAPALVADQAETLDGGLLVAHGDATDEHVVAAQ